MNINTSGLPKDCSELGSYDALYRLMGSDHEPSAFLQAMREQGFRVVLFDEIEKADPRIFDLLLGVLDEGRLSDGLGRLTSFRSSVIIMTSNLGAEDRPVDGFTASDKQQMTGHGRYYAAIADFFRPEFINRIDAIIPFNPLTEVMISDIIDRELRLITQRPGIVQRGLTLHCSPALKELIRHRGINPELGARPLQQTIDRLIIRPLAEYLLHAPRDDSLHLDWQQELIIGSE